MVARMALAEEPDIFGEVIPANQIKGSQCMVATIFIHRIRGRRYDQRRRV